MNSYIQAQHWFEIIDECGNLFPFKEMVILCSVKITAPLNPPNSRKNDRCDTEQFYIEILLTLNFPGTAELNRWIPRQKLDIYYHKSLVSYRIFAVFTDVFYRCETFIL